MGSRDVYWSFLNDQTGLQTDGLSYDQAKFVFKVIPPNEHGFWLAWHEDILDWQPLDTFTELTDETIQRRLPPEGPAHPSARETQRNSEVDERLTRRFVKRWTAELKSKDGKRFHTKTQNVSMGGLLLKDNVPAEFGKSFDLTLFRADGTSLTVFCTLVRLPNGDSARNRLRIIGNLQEGVLRNWLLNPSQE